MKVYKYPIEITDHQQIAMPKGASLLHVGYDPQFVLCVWAKVDPREKEKPIDIYMVGTGHGDTPVVGAHLGTMVIGLCVWHIFWSKKC